MKKSHKYGSNISETKVKNPSPAKEIYDKLQKKDLNPLHNEGGEARIPMEVDEPEKRERENNPSGDRQETRGSGREPALKEGEIKEEGSCSETSLEEGEIRLSLELGEIDEGIPEEKPETDQKVNCKPKTQYKCKGIKVPSTDCRDDCYTNYLKEVPDQWEPVTNMKIFEEYVQAFQKRYACYSLIGIHLRTKIKGFEELREDMDSAKRRDRLTTFYALKRGVHYNFEQEGTRYSQKMKAYRVLHKELDNLRTHIIKFYEENIRTYIVKFYGEISVS